MKQEYLDSYGTVSLMVIGNTVHIMRRKPWQIACGVELKDATQYAVTAERASGSGPLYLNAGNDGPFTRCEFCRAAALSPNPTPNER